MNLNTFHWIWNILNTCLIILVCIWINISLYIPKCYTEKVNEMEIRLDAYENVKPDSIFIQIDNHINIPKSIKVTK